MADLTALPEDARLIVQQLALHEAAHAVLAVALGFEVRHLAMAVTEGRLAGLPSVPGIPAGEAETSACDVRSEDAVRSRRAAMVALAGREARRLRFPGSGDDAASRNGEATDVGNALWHLSAKAPTPAEVIAAALDPGRRVQLNDAHETLLAPVAEATRTLLMEPANSKAVEKLVALLIERGSVEWVEIPGEKPAWAFSSELAGQDAREAILSAGVEPLAPTQP